MSSETLPFGGGSGAASLAERAGDMDRAFRSNPEPAFDASSGEADIEPTRIRANADSCGGSGEGPGAGGSRIRANNESIDGSYTGPDAPDSVCIVSVETSGGSDFAVASGALKGTTGAADTSSGPIGATNPGDSRV